MHLLYLPSERCRYDRLYPDGSTPRQSSGHQHYQAGAAWNAQTSREVNESERCRWSTAGCKPDWVPTSLFRVYANEDTKTNWLCFADVENLYNATYDQGQNFTVHIHERDLCSAEETSSTQQILLKIATHT